MPRTKHIEIRLKKLASLRPILKQWIAITRQYVRCWDGDVPWWHGERASLSLFAGAIWKAGGLAFEEYASDKRSRNKLGLYHGRADLSFQFNKQEFRVEAKKAWSCSRPSEFNPSLHISDQLTEACKDMRKCIISRTDRKLAIVFAEVKIARKHKEQTDVLIDRWIESIADVDYSACAWTFPQIARTFSYRGSLFPGGATFIKAC
jgi:hypothetical protein